MKTPFYIFVLALLLISCNNDDDNGLQQNNEPTINGSWSLVNVYGGFAGVDDNFETGLIIWDFNQDDLTVIVTNTNITNVIYDGFPSGTYNYEIVSQTNGESSIVIDTFSYTITTLTSSQLILDEGVAADGFFLSFTR